MADGLLDFFNSPTGMGLLSAVGAGLAGARRGQPLNSIGAGLLGGVHGYAQAQDQQTQMKHAATAQQMADIQLKQAQQAQADQDQMRGLAQKFYTPPSMTMDQVNAAPGQAGPTNARASLIPQTQGSFDTQGFVNGVMGIDPLRGMQLRASMAKESQFDKFKPENYTPQSVAMAMQTGDYSKLVRQDKLHFADNGGGIVGLNPFTGQQVSATDKTGDPFSDLVVRDPVSGNLIPNQPLVSAKSGIAKAGAPSVNVKNDIKMGESIAGQIGPMVKDTYTAAQGAVQTADAANRVIQAVDSGKVIAGPFANGRLTATQIADVLGVGGKDSSEKIANTRQAIRGLAEMTLQGRKQMTGQGAITESEGKLAERAMSGDITMTAAEIKQLANASRRAAQFTYNQHQAQLNNMRARSDLAGMADFYGVAPFPAGAPEPNNTGVRRYNPETGRIE